MRYILHLQQTHVSGLKQAHKKRLAKLYVKSIVIAINKVNLCKNESSPLSKLEPSSKQK